MNIVEKAIKVTSFRKAVREACRKNGLDYPCDDFIADYIESGKGTDVKKFMEKFAMTNDLYNFKHEVLNRGWRKEYEPTETELVEFYNKHGNNVMLFLRVFLREKIIAPMKPLVRETYKATIDALSTKRLVMLWNSFIEESALYGEDSHIYDLMEKSDSDFLKTHMDEDEYTNVFEAFIEKGKRYIQWATLNDGSINYFEHDDIEHTIVVFWNEIFERIMLYPSAYNFNVEIYCEGDGSTYFDDVFFPVIAKEVGYLIDGNKGTIKEI